MTSNNVKHSSDPAGAAFYDVLVIGGALAGASAAFLLKQKRPELRILIVERSEQFSRRVGEATVEISSYFLGRMLGLTRYLNESHLVKQGLRFWFSRRAEDAFDRCSEIGGRYLSRVAAYQVDRSTLDEEVLRKAGECGVEVWRGAQVEQVRLEEGGVQSATVLRGGTPSYLQSRWVVDASGVATFLARQEGWRRTNTAHPTAAAWARWTGVTDWDGVELARRYPEWARTCYGIRGTATNHFMGDGWWAWCIPLKGGDVSVGVVYDQRLLELPPGSTLSERIRQFLISRHPAAREILARARPVESDVHFRRHLAYSVDHLAGDGHVLVGDAAGFLDPFYSPGMDWVSFTVASAVKLIDESMINPGGTRPAAQAYDRAFQQSYARWFEAVYKDKYFYMGDFELMRLAFLLDLGLYYLGVASQPFRYGQEALTVPVFSNPPSVPFYMLMRLYNRRLAAIAVRRKRQGTFGRGNCDGRLMFGGYTFSPSSSWHVVKALGSWAWLELTERFRSEPKRAPATESAAVPAS